MSRRILGALLLCLSAGAPLLAETPEKGKGIDLLSSPFVRDAKGNFVLVTLKTTPFDSTADGRNRFLAQYKAGFRAALAGCVIKEKGGNHENPSPEAAGWIAGWKVGKEAARLAAP